MIEIRLHHQEIDSNPEEFGVNKQIEAQVPAWESRASTHTEQWF